MWRKQRHGRHIRIRERWILRACRWMPASIGRSRSMSVMVRSSRCAAYSLKKLHIRMSGSFRENRVGWMCILARSSGHFQRKKSSRIVPMACWRMSSWIRARSASCRSRMIRSRLTGTERWNWTMILKYIKHMESSRSRKSGMCWSAMIWENLSWLAKRFAQHS